jgi:hypothetical protein
MGTGIVNCVERSVDVEERDASYSEVHCLSLTRSDLAGLCNLDELGHRAHPLVSAYARRLSAEAARTAGLPIQRRVASSDEAEPGVVAPPTPSALAALRMSGGFTQSMPP